MNVTDSQKSEILAYLKSGHSLTPMDALRQFGCFRLAARIKELRDEGHAIDMTLEDDGQKHYARYSLVRKPAMQCAANGQGMLL